MDTVPKSNVAVVANIWTDVNNPGADPLSHVASQFVPGDLMVNILRSRDRRVLDKELTQRQREEFEFCRFFHPHGQYGHAYDKS